MLAAVHDRASPARGCIQTGKVQVALLFLGDSFYLHRRRLRAKSGPRTRRHQQLRRVAPEPFDQHRGSHRGADFDGENVRQPRPRTRSADGNLAFRQPSSWNGPSRSAVRPACFTIAVCLLAAFSAGAQPAPSPAANRVLELDGTNSAVELPPNIFSGLDQATIETWVKFRDLSNSRFYSYGASSRTFV